MSCSHVPSTAVSMHPALCSPFPVIPMTYTCNLWDWVSFPQVPLLSRQRSSVQHGVHCRSPTEFYFLLTMASFTPFILGRVLLSMWSRKDIPSIHPTSAVFDSLADFTLRRWHHIPLLNVIASAPGRWGLSVRFDDTRTLMMHPWTSFVDAHLLFGWG